MNKTFRPWTIDQPLLLPARVQGFVGEAPLARFVLALVLDHLDLREIEGGYGSERGQPPFDPAMMTALLLYACCNGVYSSRRIAKASRERVDLMSMVGLDAPDFHTVSDFRKRHLKALAGLFTQVLKLCEQAGLAKLGHVALDGTKIKANTSKHEAMSYERMAKRAAELEAEVARWMNAAEALDGREDEAFGRDKNGDEMPDWVGDKKKRAEKIRAAQAELEAEAKAAAAAEAKARAEAEEKRKAEGRKKPGRPAAPPSEEPDPKAQKNFTDPESRIMKTKDGFIQGYNAQAAADATAQVIVAHGLDARQSDQHQLAPIADAIEAIWAGSPRSFRPTPATGGAAPIRPPSRPRSRRTNMAGSAPSAGFYFPYTPATNLLRGLQEALAMLDEEGLPNVFERHQRHGAATRAAVQAWGQAGAIELQCLAPSDHSCSLTAVRLAEGQSADGLRALILSRFNMSLGNGLGILKDRVFRIGHLGDINDLTLLGAISGVEMGLKLAGVATGDGGVDAAMAMAMLAEGD